MTHTWTHGCSKISSTLGLLPTTTHEDPHVGMFLTICFCHSGGGVQLPFMVTPKSARCHRSSGHHSALFSQNWPAFRPPFGRFAHFKFSWVSRDRSRHSHAKIVGNGPLVLALDCLQASATSATGRYQPSNDLHSIDLPTILMQCTAVAPS